MLRRLLILYILIFSFSIYGSSKWKRASVASLSSLSDVFFINENLGWIVGYSGTILHTNDGGYTWEEPVDSLPVVASMYSVFFVDENNGFAGGDNNLLLNSSDGGLTWREIPIESLGNKIFSIYFADKNRGWVLSGKTYSSSTIGEILYTTDGGKSWTVQVTETLVNLKAMSFNSNGHGIAVGGTSGNYAFYYTTDGLSWNKSPNPTKIPPLYSRSDLYTVSMASDNVASATGWGSSSNGLQPTYTLRSVDGGATWTYETQDEENRIYNNLYGMKFKDELTGIAVGGSSYKGGVAYKTTDGGVSWKEIYLPVGFFGKAISWVNNRICIVGSGGGIVLSEDGGETWELITKVVTSTLYDIKQLPNGKIVAAGFFGSFLFSNDGGNTWESNYIAGNNVCPTVENLFFLDENIGYAAQRNRTLSKTTDGGISWTQIMKDTMVSTMNNYDVQFINEDVGFVVGKANTDVSVFYKTIDGGENWSTLVAHPSLTNELNTLHFFDENKGVVAGDESALAFTEDGGSNWTKVTPNNMPSGEYDFNEIEFLNNNFGLAAGEKLIKSNDGGKTWTNIEIADFTKRIESIEIVNELTWYLTGSKFLLVTEDGGVTWKDIIDLDVVTATTNYSVMVDSKGYTWLACGSSEIYFTESTVDVKLIRNNFANKFSLNTNYPNPFNPSTKIEYSLPSISGIDRALLVTLKIYDLLGQEIATLVDEKQEAGTYLVEFNASELTSGVYIYVLQSAGFSKSRKMILLR